MVAHRSNRLDGDDIEARIDKLSGEDARTGPNFQNPVRPVVIDEASQKLGWIGGSRLLVDPGVASESVFGCLVDHRQSIARSIPVTSFRSAPKRAGNATFGNAGVEISATDNPIVIRQRREPSTVSPQAAGPPPIWIT
jgi:hypothetical protein